MKLKPPLKQRHHNILLLLYRFRFLTRAQIQKLLNHKNHRKVLQWLNELTESNYLKKHNSTLEKMPQYSLSSVSRKYLKDNQLVKNPTLLDRVWKEMTYTTVFRDKCLLIADIYLQLLAELGGALRFLTKTELHGVENLIEPAPDVYFVIEKPGEKAMRYFLDTFLKVPPRVLQDRARHYAEYYTSAEWQAHTDKTFPEIIILCPNQRYRKLLRRYIRERLSDEPDLRFRVASSDQALTELLPKKKV